MELASIHSGADDKTVPESRDLPQWLPRALVILALLIAPFLVLRHDYLPPDDALRYAAKAVSGKSWNEIILMREDITIDHNPGWNALLRAVHLVTGWNPRQLVWLSVALMFAAATLPAVACFKKPEAWLLGFMAACLCFPMIIDRLFIGRPLFVTVGITLWLLARWNAAADSQFSRTLLAKSTLCMALSTWVHGSWYLLVFIPAAFCVSWHWRKGAALFGCWAAGVLAGAALTLHPWTFLAQSARIPFLALGEKNSVNTLVSEFVPYKGAWLALIPVAVLLLARRAARLPRKDWTRDPVLWMALLGGLAAVKVVRFWTDFGLPALGLWIAFQIDEWEGLARKTQLWVRTGVAAAGAAILCFYIAADWNGRWSKYGHLDPLSASDPEDRPWLPEPGGVLYSVNLSVFYQTFFANPRGEWKYALGFEPSFMLPENRAVYNELWNSLNSIESVKPWVRKMTPRDRLVLLGPDNIFPAIEGLEWHYAAKSLWVGKLPASGSAKPGPGQGR
jgi:hypothetical protein